MSIFHVTIAAGQTHFDDIGSHQSHLGQNGQYLPCHHKYHTWLPLDGWLVDCWLIWRLKKLFFWRIWHLSCQRRSNFWCTFKNQLSKTSSPFHRGTFFRLRLMIIKKNLCSNNFFLFVCIARVKKTQLPWHCKYIHVSTYLNILFLNGWRWYSVFLGKPWSSFHGVMSWADLVMSAKIFFQSGDFWLTLTVCYVCRSIIRLSQICTVKRLVTSFSYTMSLIISYCSYIHIVFIIFPYLAKCIVEAEAGHFVKIYYIFQLSQFKCLRHFLISRRYIFQ